MKDIPIGGHVVSFYNEHGHLIEVDVFYFSTYIFVNAWFCDNDSELVGFGRHGSSRKKAIKEAIKGLNRQAYGLEKRV